MDSTYSIDMNLSTNDDVTSNSMHTTIINVDSNVSLDQIVENDVQPPILDEPILDENLLETPALE